MMDDATVSPKDPVLRSDYYVYLFRDPRDNEIFYIGKGTGTRAEQLIGRNKDTTSKIEEIRSVGAQPIIELLRDDLDESTATKFEGVAIDVIGIEHLTNKNHAPGTKNWRRGMGKTNTSRMDSKLLERFIDPDEVEIKEPTILIRINQLYRNGMDDNALYDATRGIWPMSERRNGAIYAFAVFKGIVMEVYKIKSWHRAGTTPYPTRPNMTYQNIDPDRRRRWEFVGEPAENEIRERYRLKSVKKYLMKNSRFPITYVNC